MKRAGVPVSMNLPRPRSFLSPVGLIALGYLLAFAADEYYYAASDGRYGAGRYALDDDGRWSCAWNPADVSACRDLLRRRLPRPTPPPDPPGPDDPPGPRPGRQRWLLLGDSQMGRLFRASNVERLLVRDPLRMSRVGCLGQVSCAEVSGYRCNLNSAFGMPYADAWVPPRPGERVGPTNHGAENPYCYDGSGSFPSLLRCAPLDPDADNDAAGGPRPRCDADRMRHRYGGYVPVEYARDVEVQTPDFRTTQENLAAFVEREWNDPATVREWGRPVCVLGNGNHDARIKGITTGHYLKNVRFLLETFSRVCAHMVWIGNTANKRDDAKFPQTKALMEQWDGAIQRMIEGEPRLRAMMTFVEVRRAALRWPHVDHIHLDDAWYDRLGNGLLAPLIR